MDDKSINQRNKDTTVNDVPVLSSDNDEPNSVKVDGKTSPENNNSDIQGQIHKVTHDSNGSINIDENDDSCVEVSRINFESWEVLCDSEIESTSARDKNQNHRLQHTKDEICNAGELCYEVKSKIYFENKNPIEKDISNNRGLLYFLRLKLRNFLVRRNKKPSFSEFNRNNYDLEEASFDNEHYLNRFYLDKSNRSTHHRNLTDFKERVKHITRPSSVKIKDNYCNSPLRRTYQVYFGDMTAGGIEYDPESFNWIVPGVLLTVLILLVMTAAYNVFWLDTAKLDKWASSTYDPAILCAFGCIAILIIDLTLSFVAVARHPVSSWIFLIVAWVCVQFITFYIGVKCRSKHTDNMLIVIVTPAVITCGVVLEFLWLSLLKIDLTGSILPHVLSIISALSLLAVMTGMTWGTLLYEIHELAICWIVSLYYSISMIVLLQMILTEKIYEMNEYDVALPAMLLFLSPYSLITTLIRYYVFLARSQ